MGSPPPPVPPRTGPVAVASLRRYLSVILFYAWSLKPTVVITTGANLEGALTRCLKIEMKLETCWVYFILTQNKITMNILLASVCQ